MTIIVSQSYNLIDEEPKAKRTGVCNLCGKRFHLKDMILTWLHADLDNDTYPILSCRRCQK